MPRQRQTGTLTSDPQLVLRESALMLFASGMSIKRVAQALNTETADIQEIIDAVSLQARDDMISLARRCKPCLGPADKHPNAIREELRTLGIGSAVAFRYQHGIIAGPREPGQPGRNYLLELRRFSTAPGQPTDWIALAAWAFLTFEDRELATLVWTRARGLPTSIDKRHWGGVNRPIKVIQFVRLD